MILGPFWSEIGFCARVNLSKIHADLNVVVFLPAGKICMYSRIFFAFSVGASRPG